MHITILLTLSIPPGEAELPVCVRYDAYLHPEPPGPDKEEDILSQFLYTTHLYLLVIRNFSNYSMFTLSREKCSRFTALTLFRRVVF